MKGGESEFTHPAPETREDETGESERAFLFAVKKSLISLYCDLIRQAAKEAAERKCVFIRSKKNRECQTTMILIVY